MKLNLLPVAAGLVAVGATQKIKVTTDAPQKVFLGDSITEITCWRPLVWSQLSSANLTSSIQLVGSMNNLQSNCQKPAGFDAHHEGHSGYQAYDVARNNVVGWVKNTMPDVVQFMLGTNDVNIGKRDANTILGAYTSILGSLRAANPNVSVIVDKLIPTSWSDKTVEAVNTAIPGWAAQHNTSQSPVTVADCSRAGGMTNAMLRSDGVHPNDQGDQFIAKQLSPVLIRVIKAKIGASA
ncbi:SGNH hydrolase-type esterase domain-containing protein [Podospora didyma]|uniref:SGNH hydrolase-type esterase domain-containing protein n=1 Tax=Podospora didyma TaxID=330526 RepID=A0AAE0NWU7_9PEZI|nr:SGNH hydrolase-type esterase domain-containing protein [Podospora didyma]